jgi:malonyl-CoA O-methyltransferase
MPIRQLLSSEGRLSSDSQAKLSAPIDVLRVRQLFADPARGARAEFLRREVATRMHERLDLIRLDAKRVLDAGCGDGADLSTLQQRFPQAQIIGIDAAHGPLRAAQSRASAHLPVWQRWLGRAPGLNLAAANFAQLPLANNSLDGLWSNLALHWHPQPDRVFAEWQRVLRVQGLLMFSCFGPDTLQQLRHALQRAGLAHSVLPFVDMHDLGDMLLENGFAAPVMDMEKITVTWGDLAKLLLDVRALGGNPLQTRQRGLRGRVVWQKLHAALGQWQNADGLLPLSFEIIYGHAFKAQPRVAGEAVIRFEPSLAKAAGRG